MMRIFTQFFIASFICVSTAQAQYCMLPGRTSYSSFQPGIVNFKLRNINRTSSNVEKPLTQPSLVVTTDSVKLERGKKYGISIIHTRDSTVTIFANARNNIRVWLDYNNDKDFIDAGETIITKDLIMAGTFTDSFTVPSTATLGVTRLRATAKMSSDAGHSIPTPCDTPADPIDYHGEMEDYTVTIVAEGTTILELTSSKPAVYPNPTTGEISVSFGEPVAEAARIDLYDITGKLVSNLLDIPQRQQAVYTFNLDDHRLLQGIYFLKITSGNTLSYERVVKVN